MKKQILLKSVAVAVSLALAGCGGSSSTTVTNDDGGTTTARGFSLPNEISAVPASAAASASTTRSVSASSFGRAIRALASADLPPDSDYAKATGRTFVEEPALEQFDIIEQVLTSMAQTNYADEVGNGAYKAVITWEEDQDGVDVKSLQTWTVKSELVSGNHPVTGASQQVNVVQAWIPEIDPDTGNEMLIKAQFDIYTSASVAADGSFNDYGEWDLNVYFQADPNAVDSAAPQGFFAASTRIDSSGVTTLKITDQGVRNEFGLLEQMKGILVRSATTGYGKVEYPDWEQCYNPGSGVDCTDPALTAFPVSSAAYSYNDAYLAVQQGSSAVAFKDRDLAGAIKMVHRYGLFYADADSTNGIAEGDSVEKQMTFGFPVKFQMTALSDPSKQFEAWGYYGAWQGRHELWGAEDGVVIDDGVNTAPTVFTKADVLPGQTPATYTLAEFAGTFTKRNLEDASLTDIQGVPVQTWLNNNFELFNMNGEWRYCDDGYIDWINYDPATPSTLSCLDRVTNQEKTGTALVQGFSLFDLTQLAQSEGDQRWINIAGEDQADPLNPQYKQYLYLDADPQITGFTFTSAGLYEAGNEFDPDTGRLLPNSPAALIDPSAVPGLMVDVSGALYIQYVGFDPLVTSTTTGWVEKGISGIDPVTGEPTFSGTDTPFNPSREEEYYINAAGNNFIVKRTDTVDAAASYDVKRELQTAANPLNTDAVASASILPPGTSYLASPWNGDIKYTLIEDPTDANYLLLEVLSDASGNSTAGDIAETQWGLMAYDSSDQPLAMSSGTATPVNVDEYGYPVDPAQRPVEFNWEKPGDGQSWGKQRFLKETGSGSYVILSDAIALTNVAVQDSAGNAKGTLNLQFDGWMYGIPDVYGELSQNDWVMTPDIAGKVVHIAAGTEATGSDGTRYFVKPLDTSLFLGVVSTFPNGTQPDITQADSVDLTSVPGYTPHNMGATPTGTVVKYTEGNAVE